VRCDIFASQLLAVAAPVQTVDEEAGYVKFFSSAAAKLKNADQARGSMLGGN
jgi:hypothetical protein